MLHIMKLGELTKESRSTYSVKEEKDGDLTVYELEPSDMADMGYTWFHGFGESRSKTYRSDNKQIQGQIIKFLDVLVCVKGPKCGNVAILNPAKDTALVPTPAAFVILRFEKPLHAFFAYQSLKESDIGKHVRRDSRNVKTLSQATVLDLRIPKLTEEAATWAYLKFTLAEGLSSLLDEWQNIEGQTAFQNYAALLKGLRGLENKIRNLRKEVINVQKKRKTKKSWQEI